MATVMVEPDLEIREDLRSFGKAWWLFLVAGIVWTWVGFMILNFDARSVALISLMIGFVLFLAAVEEGISVFMMEGWKWLHAILALLFLFGGIWAFAYPGQTFGTLALLVGWYLLIKGMFDICVSIASVGLHLWWLGLIVGIAELMLGIWAVGYPGRSAALLVLWIGLGAIIRGVGEIVMAFQVRRLKKAVA